MAINYCNVDDVKLVVRAFSQDYTDEPGGNPTLNANITSAIVEASDICRTILMGRYDLSLFGTTVPNTVRDYTKIKAGQIVFSREGATRANRKEIGEMLQTQLVYYENQILFGNIIDSSMNVIDSTQDFVAVKSEGDSSIEAIYEDRINVFEN